MPDLHERSTSIVSHSDGDLEEIQRVLLVEERRRLDKLEDRLKNSVVDAPLVANVLPDAIRQCTKQDQHLEKSLAPIIGKTFDLAIKDLSQDIAGVFYPVMGPAIRKAVAAALQDAVQFMNRTLDHSLSWRGMTWRWEAWRTGKSFADVVMSHTLQYRVERVFLFFREDGVHLGEVNHPSIRPFEHKDLASSMFSAIQTTMQKFAHDEFQASEHAPLKAIEIDDDLTVLIEQGPKASLAAVVRGVLSPSFRPAFQDALGSIHVELNEALQNFRGDKQPFESAKPYLESCLLQEESDSPRKTDSARGVLSPALVVLLTLIVGLFGWWGITSYLEQRRWADFQDKARETPGIHITSTTTNGKNGKTTVYGLRDPLSDNPQEIARDVGLSHETIDFRLEPYLSLAPELIEQRASVILNPPKSVQLSVPNGTTVLNIAGTAPHAWITQLSKLDSTIPGVTSIQYDGLQDESRLRLDQLVQEIEGYQVDFEAGSASLSEESGVALQAVRRALRESNALAQQLGNRMRVEIHGHTSEEGSAEANRRLALTRAQEIQSALNVERFPAIEFRSVAESVEPLGTATIQGSNPLRARRASLHVTVNDSRSTGPRL
jgi:outer membrane protein OmpA-like peptidoglycan-associated protein